MTRFHTAVALCLSLLVAACLPVTSTSPVGSTAGLKSDPALFGIWKGKPKGADNNSYFVFLPPKGDAQDDMGGVLIFSLDPNDSGLMTMSIQTSELGNLHFMNARMVSEDAKPSDDPESKNTFPVLYEFSHGKLTLYLIDEDAVKAAIAAGKIEGMIEPGTYGDVVITASPEKLDAFMQSKDGRALFREAFAVLMKVE
ncbi:MAG: hypothetical protein HY243_10980 [Proteobacteria bacterium]|nr:hypothetical protein [Pseudomonadota bacterium]